MNILWFTWKDKKNPMSGGAEIVNEEIAKRLVKNGHKVIFFVASFPKCIENETINGYQIIRRGNKYTVYLHALLYYQQHLHNWPTLVIEEINTIPFMTQWYCKQNKLLFIHQLCREIWFYQFFFPFNILGYLIEPIYLKMLSKNKTITVSQSTKQDLIHIGFKEKNISIIPEASEITPVSFPFISMKYCNFTILSLGNIRAMKRTFDQIMAFELAKNEIPELKLIIAGDSNNYYGKQILQYISKSKFKKDIKIFGKVDLTKKKELMQKSHILLSTSVKEGWGLTVTEAASQGTPAIVYNIDGLRDSVTSKTGIICSKNNPKIMSLEIIKLFKNKKLYYSLVKNAWKSSLNMNFDNTFKSFIKIITNSS